MSAVLSMSFASGALLTKVLLILIIVDIKIISTKMFRHFLRKFWQFLKTHNIDDNWDAKQSVNLRTGKYQNQNKLVEFQNSRKILSNRPWCVTAISEIIPVKNSGNGCSTKLQESSSIRFQLVCFWPFSSFAIDNRLSWTPNQIWVRYIFFFSTFYLKVLTVKSRAVYRSTIFVVLLNETCY